jgi:integrase
MDARTSLSNQPEINAALLGYYTELQEVFKRFEVAEVIPSLADVKNAFNARHRSDDLQAEQTSDKPDASAELYKAFDEFVWVCSRQND